MEFFCKTYSVGYLPECVVDSLDYSLYDGIEIYVTYLYKPNNSHCYVSVCIKNWLKKLPHAIMYPQPKRKLQVDVSEMKSIPFSMWWQVAKVVSKTQYVAEVFSYSVFTYGMINFQ